MASAKRAKPVVTTKTVKPTVEYVRANVRITKHTDPNLYTAMANTPAFHRSGRLTNLASLGLHYEQMLDSNAMLGKLLENVDIEFLVDMISKKKAKLTKKEKSLNGDNNA